MTKNNIERIKQTRRLQLKKSQLFSHYYVVLLPVIPIGFLVYDDLDNLRGIALWIFLFIALILFFIQYRQLRFKAFTGNCTNEDLTEAIYRASNELEWKVEKVEIDFLQAYFSDPLNWYGGNLITIIRTDNGFLINSVSDPRYRTIPLISTWNKDNTSTYLKHLSDVVNKKPENKDYLIPEKEWTLKKIITRLILYPFLIFIIIVSLKIIIDPVNSKNNVGGILGLLFGIGYIYIDIKLIMKRKKHERKTLN